MTLRVGIFGVGRMGRVHVEHMVQLAGEGNIQFAAIGDRFDQTRHATLGMIGEWGAETLKTLAEYDSPERMADAAKLDAVVVASGTADHARDAMVLMQRGIPVMVEKPMTNTVGEAAELTRVAEESGSRVFVAFQRHYDAAARQAMEWSNGGRIGLLQQSHHVIQDKNPTPVGYQSCGITADMAIHLVFEAMAFHQFELPTSVQAVRFNAPHYEDRAQEGANVVHTFCTWQDGSVAHLWGSRLNSTGYDNGFKLIGTNGRIDVGDFVGDFGEISAKLWEGTKEGGPIARGTLTEHHTYSMTKGTAAHPDFFARYATAYRSELEAFLGHVRDGSPMELGVEIGWKTLLTANLAEASSRRGGEMIKFARTNGDSIRTVGEAIELANEYGVA